MSAVQISEYAYMKNGHSAYSSANGGTEFWNNTYKPYIRTITFGNDLSNLPIECTEENLCWDVSYSSSQNKKVYGYLVDSGLVIEETDTSTSTTTTKPLYNLYIVSEAPIFAPIDCRHIFDNFRKLIQINFNNNFNTSKVTNMSDMFSECSSLSSLNLSNFNTTNVTKMNSMFSSCSSLITLDLSSFNTSNVTDMSGMFSNCRFLTSLDLSNFNTTNVTNMSGMFNSCTSLMTLDLSSFNTSNVVDFNKYSNTDGGMFYGCSKLQTQINITNANTATYAKMFESAASDPSAHIIIGYIADTETIVTAMRDTCTDTTAKARIELKKID